MTEHTRKPRRPMDPHVWLRVTLDGFLLVPNQPEFDGKREATQWGRRAAKDGTLSPGSYRLFRPHGRLEVANDEVVERKVVFHD